MGGSIDNLVEEVEDARFQDLYGYVQRSFGIQYKPHILSKGDVAARADIYKKITEAPFFRETADVRIKALIKVVNSKPINLLILGPGPQVSPFNLYPDALPHILPDGSKLFLGDYNVKEVLPKIAQSIHSMPFFKHKPKIAVVLKDKQSYIQFMGGLSKYTSFDWKNIMSGKDLFIRSELKERRDFSFTRNYDIILMQMIIGEEWKFIPSSTFDIIEKSLAGHHAWQYTSIFDTSFREASRVLKKGGTFLLMDGNWDSTYVERKVLKVAKALSKISNKEVYLEDYDIPNTPVIAVYKKGQRKLHASFENSKFSPPHQVKLVITTKREFTVNNKYLRALKKELLYEGSGNIPLITPDSEESISMWDEIFDKGYKPSAQQIQKLIYNGVSHRTSKKRKYRDYLWSSVSKEFHDATSGGREHHRPLKDVRKVLRKYGLKKQKKLIERCNFYVLQSKKLS